MAASLVAGTFFGLSFTPVIYTQDNIHGASRNGLDYVFAFFTGILLTSTAYVIIYAALKRNAPFANPRTILPGIVSGALWAVGETAWFIANDSLSEAISFPIITRVLPSFPSLHPTLHPTLLHLFSFLVL